MRRADFADSGSLVQAFQGVRKVLIVSTTTVGERYDNHVRAIDAAKDAGAELIVYTSTLNARTAGMMLADAHAKTEQYLRDSGVPFVVLRNGWYLENYTSQFPLYLETGVVLGSAGGGRVGAASRRDYAEAAAAVLAGEGHAGSVYELGGETPSRLPSWPPRCPTPQAGMSSTATFPPSSTVPRSSTPGCPPNSPKSSPTPTWGSSAASCSPAVGICVG